MEYDLTVQHVYADALLAAAARTGATDQIFEQANVLYRYFRENSRIRHFLESPRIRKDAKHQVMDRIFRGRIETLLLNFIHVMLENNRIENLDETLQLVCDLVEEKRGVIPASVTTAVELAPEQRRVLHQALEERLGLRFDIRYRVNPNVLGGVVFKYRDRLLDGSLRFDLQKLRERLKAVAVG